MINIIKSKTKLQRVEMVDIPPSYTMKIYENKKLEEAHGSILGFVINSQLGKSDIVEPCETIYFYDKSNLD